MNITADRALVLVGGVGYEVYCSGSAFSKMTEGAECELYTYLQVSETSGVTLFGFSGAGEKEAFLKLISVSGVGPKMGLAVLTYMSVDDFVTAVATNDVKRLSQVKGLGKKTAERIILELREKVALPKSASGERVSVGAAVPVSDGDEDAVVALMTLGFTRAESEKAVVRAKQRGASSVEEIIRSALQSM